MQRIEMQLSLDVDVGWQENGRARAVVLALGVEGFGRTIEAAIADARINVRVELNARALRARAARAGQLTVTDELVIDIRPAPPPT